FAAYLAAGVHEVPWRRFGDGQLNLGLGVLREPGDLASLTERPRALDRRSFRFARAKLPPGFDRGPITHVGATGFGQRRQPLIRASGPLAAVGFGRNRNQMLALLEFVRELPPPFLGPRARTRVPGIFQRDEMVDIEFVGVVEDLTRVRTAPASADHIATALVLEFNVAGGLSREHLDAGALAVLVRIDPFRTVELAVAC